MSKLNVITVSIGRNVPAYVYDERDFHQDGKPTEVQVPMSDERWATFADDAAEELRVTGEMTRNTDRWEESDDFTLEVHYGKGCWDGVREDSCKVTLLSERPITHVASLRRRLSELARHYDQDAIALTVGTSELC